MNLLLVILIIIMLISAYDLRVPEPPPAPDFFQAYLGWDIYQTAVILFGGWLAVFFVVVVIGRITGWSKGLWFDPDKNTSENEKVTGSLMKIGIVVLVIASVIALYVIM